MIRSRRSMDYKLFWSDESLKNLRDIIHYLESEWSEKEVNRFKLKLSKQLDLIIKNPKTFPVSEFQPRLRKAVLVKQTTII
jgi:plasmid stabilization system protein ParE